MKLRCKVTGLQSRRSPPKSLLVLFCVAINSVAQWFRATFFKWNCFPDPSPILSMSSCLRVKLLPNIFRTFRLQVCGNMHVLLTKESLQYLETPESWGASCTVCIGFRVSVAAASDGWRSDLVMLCSVVAKLCFFVAVACCHFSFWLSCIVALS